MRVLGIFGIAAVLALSGCARTSPGSSNGEYFDVSTVKTPEGSVICISSRYSNSSGISCDWEHVK